MLARPRLQQRVCAIAVLLRHTLQLDHRHPHRSVASRYTPRHRRRRSDAPLRWTVHIQRRHPYPRTLDISPPILPALVQPQLTRSKRRCGARPSLHTARDRVGILYWN
ncbi:hypothetical protein K438DRAFT_1989833 [Mycena galopus ATCC 62051]|nr:hypothetical protein K438DRAFT_1989833 [Mycena galopus ATCC 62051]